MFDDEVQQCFAECTAVDTPDFTWQQAQLSLSRPQLSVQAYRMRFVGLIYYPFYHPMPQLDYQLLHPQAWAFTWSLLNFRLRDIFNDFCHSACLAPQLEMGGWSKDRTRPADVLVPNWVLGLNLHQEPNEFQVAIKWWLGGQVEVGSGPGLDRLHSRPADIVVNNWHLGKPAAFDLTITSPLNPITLTEARCAELGWVCIPLAVESYGCWGTEAQQSFSRLAARLAIKMGCNKPQATTILYQRLSLSLVRAMLKALLFRARFQHSEEGG
eukprot:Em0017g586a